jgi:hypothetical protein
LRSRKIDASHAANAQFAFDAVAIGKGLLKGRHVKDRLRSAAWWRARRGDDAGSA